MRSIGCTFMLLLLLQGVKAQQLFIAKGKITFEKKINIQRSLADLNIEAVTKDQMKKYSLSTWELSFDQHTSLYKAAKKENMHNGTPFLDFLNPPENELYTDHTRNSRILKKRIMGDDYLLRDTIPKVSWKIMHELRTIAGYECRKAIGRINDTVYVVAFYTDDILFRGGPEGFSGLPGMILGLAIPRYYTTWFAEKVEAINYGPGQIVAPAKGKKTDTAAALDRLIELYSRHESPVKENPEEAKKRLLGFVL